MKKEVCSGLENNPVGFITRGSTFRRFNGDMQFGYCYWLRIGRLRVGRYIFNGKLIRPAFAAYETGWQITAAKAFVSFTYKAAFQPTKPAL